MAWDEERFWNATPSYFFKAIKGFNDLEHERQKVEWERLRLLGVWVLSPHTKKGQQLTTEKLLPLPWDKQISWKERNKEILEQCEKIIKEHG